MKIEIDLLSICDDEGGVLMGRTCAVALLSALPDDAAELAVSEWEAVRAVRANDDRAQREAVKAHQDGMFEGMPDSLKNAIEGLMSEKGKELRREASVPPQDVGYMEAVHTVDIPKTAPGRPAPEPHVAEALKELEEKNRQRTQRDALDASKTAREFIQNYGEGIEETPKTVHEIVAEVEARRSPKHYPAYEVGDWVMTDLGYLAKVIAIKADELVVELDDGEQHPQRVTYPASRVCPATKEEIDRMTVSVPEPSKNGSKKQQRKRAPKKTAEPSPAINGGAAESVPVVDEKAAKYEKASLRELCRIAENEAGRARLVELFKGLGVGKLGDLDPKRAEALRIAVLELVP